MYFISPTALRYYYYHFKNIIVRAFLLLFLRDEKDSLTNATQGKCRAPSNVALYYITIIAIVCTR